MWEKTSRFLQLARTYAAWIGWPLLRFFLQALKGFCCKSISRSPPENSGIQEGCMPGIDFLSSATLEDACKICSRPHQLHDRRNLSSIGDELTRSAVPPKQSATRPHIFELIFLPDRMKFQISPETLEIASNYEE